ncbi:hypothetical protein A3D78_00725 [Candidatus Gottesmanbacteria bacterium RIFCSPHIGHO2_02_FULL_39_14]|uniref:alcohol dehydrogenase n=2 Tax=Candidatus Gottesmaniibacteriota TaxID=1752720 RepID=A0A1F6A074_9BACT|nr:MAG: hypothetical protein A3D78_00725 [Candidatus Gottesmanbacteria bacterium RIFCSPHIGHO2_02_FULL_39_14]OGG32286.1 MAG: hypothetical protein A3I51_01335 [Candidatus Gottesmanbacteria bacterium RIFCSPLOWO2_02_FULL_38_8]
MKAVVLTKTGSLTNLKQADLAKPVIQNGEALVKIEYCGVNHLDLLIIEGKRPVSGKFPLILGSEVTGREVKTGEKVAIYPWIFCGQCEFCKKGQENICNQGGTFGRTRQGGYAEYISVPKQNLIKIDKNTDTKKICAVTLSAITAWHMIKRAKIPDKATVLINGATGGVGTTAIQILKNKKCQVIARTSHNQKVGLLKKLGADTVLLNTFPENVLFIIDAMGGRVWTKSVEILAKNGTLVFCATTLTDPGIINIGKAFSKQLNILGSYGGTIKDIKEVIKMVKTGIIKPVIDSIYPLEKVPEALKRLQEQKAFGKILIKI